MDPTAQTENVTLRVIDMDDGRADRSKRRASVACRFVTGAHSQRYDITKRTQYFHPMVCMAEVICEVCGVERYPRR